MLAAIVRKLLIIGVLLSTGVVQAQDTLAGSEPHALVAQMTDDLLANMEQYRDTVAVGSEQFFDYLEGRLDSIVDFGWIAKNVMGPYRKQASAAQRERFAAVFRRGLVETYGRGLMTYSDEKIAVLPPVDSVAGKRKVKVKQEIHGKTTVYPVSYSMGLNKKGQWKITNVVLNGVNLGKTFRNQFIQAAKKHGGDIDKVIDGWVAEV